MIQFEDYYKGKTVLVTGHTGFKGSWLSIWLLSLGAKVIGLSLDPITDNDNYTLCNLKNKMIDIRGDIRDPKTIEKVFTEHKPEIVFHLAAQAIVRKSYEIPRETFEHNVMGTINILEGFKSTDESKVCICITTDKVYKNNEWVWGYRENDPFGGNDPYSASKGACEIAINSYIQSFFHPKDYNEHHKIVASVRAGNVIGGGDWAEDRIVPDCIRAIENNESIYLRMPEAIRPWQHVLEPLSGYLLLGSQALKNPEKYSGGWNFGPNADSIINVRELTEKIIGYYGKDIKLECKDSKLHEAKLLSLDCSKARFSLGWVPTLDINETIQLTVDWYKKYNVYSDVYELCVEEITQYSELAKGNNVAWIN